MLDSFIALDIETTGLSPENNQVIEIGAVLVQDGKAVEEFKSLIQPGILLPTRIVELTGITDEMLLDAPEKDAVLREFLSFSGDLPVLGHNVLFDYSFMKMNYYRMGISYQRKGMDTLKLSRSFHAEQSSKSLSSMCQLYQITNKNAHRALDDARAAYELYYRLRDNFGHQAPELFKESDLVYKIKKVEPITPRQKNYLNDLLKYHKIELEQPVVELTKSEASRLIDKIILQYGK